MILRMMSVPVVVVGLAVVVSLSPLISRIACGDSTAPWTYQADAAVRPLARSIPLGVEPPEAFFSDVPFSSEQPRYAQLRYGSENSRRVTIVLDEQPNGEMQFYADVDRDRFLVPEEQLKGEGRSRTFSLPVEIIKQDQSTFAARRVQIRLNATKTQLSVATLGCVEGELPRLGNRRDVRARRIDGNGNGLFTDSRDRVMLDLNGDGRWDAINEAFAYLPVLSIGETRYGVASDRLARRFSLTEISGVGKLRVSIANLPPNQVQEFEAMIYSNDGSAYSLAELNRPLTVPVGKYTLGSLTLTIDNGDKHPWHFVFSRDGAIPDSDWRDVGANEDVALEGIGKPVFQLHVANNQASPGDAITVSPRLHTQHGLLINMCSRGKSIGSFYDEREHRRCEMRLKLGEDTLSFANSGFA